MADPFTTHHMINRSGILGSQAARSVDDNGRSNGHLSIIRTDPFTFRLLTLNVCTIALFVRYCKFPAALAFSPILCFGPGLCGAELLEKEFDPYTIISRHRGAAPCSFAGDLSTSSNWH
jgi:hypothetical protein